MIVIVPEWIPIEDVLAVVNDDNWHWPKNPNCKYIEMRIDTRMRMCLLKDRHGKSITLEQFKFQFEAQG